MAKCVNVKTLIILHKTVQYKTQYTVQWNLDLVTLLVSAKIVTKLYNVTKSLNLFDKNLVN